LLGFLRNLCKIDSPDITCDNGPPILAQRAAKYTRQKVAVIELLVNMNAELQNMKQSAQDRELDNRKHLKEWGTAANR